MDKNKPSLKSIDIKNVNDLVNIVKHPKQSHNDEIHDKKPVNPIAKNNEEMVSSTLEYGILFAIVSTFIGFLYNTHK